MGLEEYKGVFVFAQQVDNVLDGVAFELLGKEPPMAIQDHDALHDSMATLELFHLFEKEINQ